MKSEYFKKPSMLLFGIMVATSKLWSDKLYLKFCHYLKTGKKLNLENPTTYSEKCQWMKLYYQRPELNQMVDKYEVKKYVVPMRNM